MKNTRTTIKELTARYRAVLHKCFLLNMAIMATAAVALPAQALTKFGLETPGGVLHEGYGYLEFRVEELPADTEYVIDGVQVYVKGDNPVTIQEGDNYSFLNTGRLDSKTLVEIQGGTVSINSPTTVMEHEGGIYGDVGVSISGGTINMEGGCLIDEENINEGFVMSGGTINAKTTETASITIGSASSNDGRDMGRVHISGGEINILSGADTPLSDLNGSALLLGQDITISGGALNIANGAALKTIAASDDDETNVEKSTIKLVDAGVINLSGKLIADVTGVAPWGNGKSGTLNINDSTASMDGTAEYVNLNINADYKLDSTKGIVVPMEVPEEDQDGGDDVYYSTYLSEVNVADSKHLTIQDVQIYANSLSLGSDSSVTVDGCDAVLSGKLDQSLNRNTINVKNDAHLTFHNYNNPIDISNSVINVTEGSEVALSGDVKITDSQIRVDGFDIDDDGDIDESVIYGPSSLNISGSDVTKSKLTLSNNGDLDASSIDIKNTTINIFSDGHLSAYSDLTISDSILNLGFVDGPESGGIETDNKLITLNNTKTTINDGGEIFVDDNTYGGQVLSYDEFLKDKELVAQFGGYDDEDSSYLSAYEAYNEYDDYMQETATYDFGKLAVNGGEINVVKGVESFEFPTNSEEDFSVKVNMLLANDIALSNKAQLNVKEGATLFTFAGQKDGLPENNATINLDATSAVNLAGTLHGDMMGSGVLNVDHANAVLAGDLDGVNVNINSNIVLADTFKGKLNAGKTTITSGSTLDIGTNTLTTDSFEVADNGTLAFQISGKESGEFGSIKANAIEISKTGTNLNLTLDAGVLAKDETQTFTVLDSANIKGSFASLSTNSKYEFTDNGDGSFNIKGVASAGDVVEEIGGTQSDKEAADSWDKGGFVSGSAAEKVANFLSTLVQKAPEAFKQAIKALQPDAAPAGQSTASAVNNQIANAVSGRLGGSPSVGIKGHAGGDVFKNSAVWAQGLVSKSKLDTQNGFDGKTKGLAIGIDGEAVENLRTGFGYAYTKSDIDAAGRTTDVDAHTLMAYGQYDMGQVFVNGLATYGRSKYEEAKNVGGLKVKADYDMDAVFTQVMGGYHIDMSGLTVTPQTGLRYLWTKTHAYTDTADQHVSSNTTDTLTGVVGTEVSTAFKADKAIITPSVKLMATYDLKNDNGGSVVSLANGSSYAVQGKALKRFGVETGAGLNMSIGNVELGLNYEGRFKKDYTDHTGLINLKYHF